LARNAANFRPRQLHRGWIGVIFSVGLDSVGSIPEGVYASRGFLAGDIDTFGYRSGNGGFSGLLFRVLAAAIFAEPS
jgi:hypothetical protein